MGCRLYLGILRQVSAAMAARTIGQPGVIHHRRCPVGKSIDVTGVTFCCHLNMANGFGQGILGDKCPVMAGRTSAAHSDVAHLGRFEGIEILVAIAALLRTHRNVAGRFPQGCCSVVACRTVAIGGGGMNKAHRRPRRR